MVDICHAQYGFIEQIITLPQDGIYTLNFLAVTMGGIPESETDITWNNELVMKYFSTVVATAEPVTLNL